MALVVNSVLPDWACRKLPIPALLMSVCNTKHAAQGKTLQTKRAASNRRLRKGQEVSENQEYNNFNGYNHSPESSTKTDYCHLVVWSLIASHKDSERTSESAVVVVGHSRRGHDMSQPPSSRRCLFFAASGPLLIMWRIWKLSLILFSPARVCSENILSLWWSGAVVKQGLMSSLNEMFVLRYLNWHHVADTHTKKTHSCSHLCYLSKSRQQLEDPTALVRVRKPLHQQNLALLPLLLPPPPLTQRLLQLILDKWCCWAFLSSLSWPGSNTHTWFIQLITNLTQRNLFAAAVRSNTPPPDTFHLHAPKDDDEPTAGINEKQTVWQLYLCCIQLRGTVKLMKNWRLWTCFLHQWGKSF